MASWGLPTNVWKALEFKLGGRAIPAPITYSQEMAASESIAIMTIPYASGGAPVGIDGMVVYSTSQSLRVTFSPYNKGATGLAEDSLRRSVSNIGLLIAYSTMEIIGRGRSIEMVATEWDPANNVYVAQLRQPMQWPYGGIIRLWNPLATPIAQVTAVVSYRRN